MADLNVRKARSRGDGAEIIVDDRTFDPAIHAELDEPAAAPAVDEEEVEVAEVVESKRSRR